MSTEETTTTEPSKTEAGEPKAKSAAQTIIAAVADRLNGSVDLLKEKFGEVLFQREIDSRVATLDAAMKKRVELEREVKKVSKPDSILRDGSGAVVVSGYTEAASKALKEAKEKLERFDAALETALNEGKFEKLKEMTAKSSGEGKQGEKPQG